jgi:hypothetical protein
MLDNLLSSIFTLYFLGCITVYLLEIFIMSQGELHMLFIIQILLIIVLLHKRSIILSFFRSLLIPVMLS